MPSHMARVTVIHVAQPANGSTARTAAFSKSDRFRVTTLRSCLGAIAALRLSLTGMAFPDARSLARRAAAGRTICPFDETVVFTPSKITSYWAARAYRSRCAAARVISVINIIRGPEGQGIRG